MVHFLIRCIPRALGALYLKVFMAFHSVKIKTLTNSLPCGEINNEVMGYKTRVFPVVLSF